MKKVILFSAALLSASVFAAPAAQQEPAHAMTTAQVVDLCKHKESPQAVGFCNGFGQGVYDSYLVTRHPKKAPSTICVKQPAPQRQQVLDDFMAWAGDHPEYDAKPAAESVLRFLSDRFPCGK